MSLSLVCASSHAQDKKAMSYYLQHENELYPDAQSAFRKGDYERASELCEWYYIIVGDNTADALREKTNKCIPLSRDLKDAEAVGKMVAAVEKAEVLLSLNPYDAFAKEVSRVSISVPPEMTGDAAKYYPKAMKGDDSAQLSLGYSYRNGLGVERDDAEGVKWYFRSARQGNSYAQNNLGCCYEDGYGVEKDYAEAVKWYQKAADQGNATALFNLGECYENGYGFEVDYSMAVRLYRESAEKGFAAAQRHLGLCYENGLGVTLNYAEAKKWFQKALESGSSEAKDDLDRIAEKM